MKSRLVQFAQAVEEMRLAQKVYFALRRNRQVPAQEVMEALQASKRAEKLVDSYLKIVLAEDPDQTALFEVTEETP